MVLSAYQLVRSPTASSEVTAPFSPDQVIRSSPLAVTPPISSPQQQPPIIQQPKLSPRRIPTGVITSQHAVAIQNQLWLQNSRINGVKPEIIGGSFASPAFLPPDVKPPLRLSPGAAPLRQTPTVIMGEAGGVRTMIWSQPQLTPAQAAASPELHATTSGWAGGVAAGAGPGSNPEESAAQMLLNLGQERSRVSTDRLKYSPIFRLVNGKGT